MQAVVFALAALWLVRIRRPGVPPCDYRWHLQVLTGANRLGWLNATPLRTLHHLTVVLYELVDMSQSMLVRASVSVFWAQCELAAMTWTTGAQAVSSVSLTAHCSPQPSSNCSCSTCRT
ncbi:hypothetical protein [Paraburkholderia strydomiana]